jgi:dTDP-4-dehydrorhamnose reductase
MKILVTGVNGQVGFYLSKQLADDQTIKCIALDRPSLDITNKKLVREKINKFEPDVVINAAAYTAVDKAEQEVEAAYKINADAAGYIASAAADVGAPIFHISTDYVFSGEKDIPYNEEDAVGPIGVYGKSKLKGELLVAKHNPKYIILRTSWVFGVHGSNFVKTMLSLGKTKNELGIISDQKGAPTFAEDISNTLIKMAGDYQNKGNIPWGVYHYSGFPYVTWYDFAQEIFRLAEIENLLVKPRPRLIPLTTKQYPTPAKRPKYSMLDCEKIVTNFEVAQSDWEKAITNISQYL